jgi:hypothetical protein
LKLLAEHLLHNHKSNQEIRYELDKYNLKQFNVNYKGPFKSKFQAAEEIYFDQEKDDDTITHVDGTDQE